MGRPRSRDGKIIPATSFGTTRTFDAAGRPIDMPPATLTADHSRDCTCHELARIDRPCPACEAGIAELRAGTVSTPIPSPQKEIIMAPATTPATTSTPSDALATTSDAVPVGLPIAPEDWAALSEPERVEAIAIYRAEVGETVRDLAIEFTKIKVPTGGGQFWVLPNGEPAKDFQAVVVAHFKARAYWPVGEPVSNNPPTCSSFDGRVPVSGKGPTGATSCGACPYSKYGTGKEGRGQACKERMNVFLMMEDSDLPRLLSLPPTSLKLFSRYARDLVDRKPVQPLSTLITRFGLGLKSGGEVPDYSIVLPTKTERTLDYAEVRAILAIRKKFQEAMSQRGITDVEVEEGAEDTNGHDTVIDHDTGEVIDGKARREQAGF